MCVIVFDNCMLLHMCIKVSSTECACICVNVFTSSMCLNGSVNAFNDSVCLYLYACQSFTTDLVEEL